MSSLMANLESLVETAKQALHIPDDRVSLVVVNSTPLPVSITAWPVRNEKDKDFSLEVYRGIYFDDQILVPGTTSTDKEVVIGSIRRPTSVAFHEHFGWLFFDLVRPDRYRIHLQAFVNLTHEGVQSASLGKLDLDSSFAHPMPSGTLGRVDSSEAAQGKIKFVITEDIQNIQNVDVIEEDKPSIIPGKGIETSSYVSRPFSLITLIVGSEGRYHEYAEPTHPKPHQIEHSVHKIEGLHSRSVDVWVEHDDKVFFKGSVKVNPLTGAAKGPGFASTLETPALFSKDGKFTLNYGFYDAGEGKHDQLYVYVTPNHSNWLGDLIASDSHWRDVPFSKLALPAVHDSGMFEPLDPGLLALIQSGKLSDALANKVVIDVGTPVLHFLVKALEDLKLNPQRIINNIANTQKDHFPNQLAIGARFFDFRPGFCFYDVIKLQKGRIHHQHALVPGCEYVTFLISVLEFLAAHPAEIVVVEIKKDGFVLPTAKIHDGKVVALSMVPTVEDLAACLVEAKAKVSTDEAREIAIGGPTDLDSSIGELIDSKKRFIIIDKVHFPDAWPREDSYDHKAYNTSTPAPIIAALESTYLESSHPSPPTPGVPSKGTIYQLQATPTANIEADLEASWTYSDCSSLLVGMKSVMDRQTYPWILSHTFEEDGNVVLLNDFVDGVLVELAIKKSKERAKALLEASN